MLKSLQKYILRIFEFSSQWYEQTFDVTLEELGQDAIRGQLVKHTAEELLGYTCYIPWDQHTAKHHRENGCVGQAATLLNSFLNSSVSTVNI